MLERLRARKTPEELKKLKIASDIVIDSMMAVVASHGPGATKAEMTEALRREETSRGLTFDYLLIAAGSSLNRAPSDEKWEKGDVLSLDLGGNYHGYIGDLARMAIIGEPDAELVDLLAEVEAIEQASMKPIRTGVMGGDIYAATDELLHKSKLHNHIHFLAHGMGLVSTRRRVSPIPDRRPTTPMTRRGRLKPGWWCRSRRRCNIPPRLHQARGYGRRDADGL